MMCTDGDYCKRIRKSFLKSFIQHGIKDDCKKALQIAFDEVTEEKDNYQIQIMLLLAMEKYDNCYNLIRWVSSSRSSEQRVLPCAVHQNLSADMANYHSDAGWSPLDQWSANADVFEDLDWLFGTQQSKLARLSISIVENPPSHSLYIGLPVMIINMATLRKVRSMKEGFWTFMLGTHPRLGKESKVREITWLSPVIRRIYKFCHFQPEIDQAILVLENHLVQMLRICRLRSLLMDIVDENTQSMWTMNACTVCQKGGDCLKGVYKTYDVNKGLKA